MKTNDTQKHRLDQLEKLMLLHTEDETQMFFWFANVPDLAHAAERARAARASCVWFIPRSGKVEFERVGQPTNEAPVVGVAFEGERVTVEELRRLLKFHDQDAVRKIVGQDGPEEGVTVTHDGRVIFAVAIRPEDCP